ncbi:alpha/beta-hydrolase [Coniochaeta ligniaria NRRL 30616]|uniref:Alpha/beta-hydrolase n=1 Tax=Coniochaeta ligniaria NRRL 30616 TaxID=1408157 RepID=A0A1J7JPR5_9PEZI|nr:alpha/beta-hydrolase [Coniochaeta ligniaria NRRL 30616]
MSTMKATHGHNEACCNIPPVVSSGYPKKGAYETIGDKKTYVTGPADATKGILVVADIFGFFDQTLQGSDILATSDAHTKYRVFVPDLLNGDPCPIEWYPPTDDDKQKKLGAWFGKHAPQAAAEEVVKFVKTLQEKNPGIKSWGIVGYCWGGKVVSLVTSGSSNPFSIAAEVHPAMVDPSEAEGIKVPLILLASKEEPADKVKEFEDKLKVAKHVETFGDQVHGWMAARADLSDARVKEEYTRGYKTLVEFFAKNWK